MVSSTINIKAENGDLVKNSTVYASSPVLSSSSMNVSMHITDTSQNIEDATLNINPNTIKLILYGTEEYSKQASLYFGSLFNGSFNADYMWYLLAQGTNEQINATHLTEALSPLISNIDSLFDALHIHVIDYTKHLTQYDRDFLTRLEALYGNVYNVALDYLILKNPYTGDINITQNELALYAGEGGFSAYGSNVDLEIEFYNILQNTIPHKSGGLHTVDAFVANNNTYGYGITTLTIPTAAPEDLVQGEIGLYSGLGGFTAQIDLGDGQVVRGYYYEDKFYSDQAHQNELPADEDMLYIDLTSDRMYIYDSVQGKYIQITADAGVVEGYYNQTNGKFYRSLVNGVYSDEITGNSGALYLDKSTNTLYRYDSANHAFAQISGSGGGQQGNAIVFGYYNNSLFYSTRSGNYGSYTYSNPIAPDEISIYVDRATSEVYKYSNSSYVKYTSKVSLTQTPRIIITQTGDNAWTIAHKQLANAINNTDITSTASSYGHIISGIYYDSDAPNSQYYGHVTQTEALKYNTLAEAKTIVRRTLTDAAIKAQYFIVSNNASVTEALGQNESAIFIGEGGFTSTSAGDVNEYYAGTGLLLNSLTNTFSVNLGYIPASGSSNYPVQADLSGKLYVYVPSSGGGTGDHNELINRFSSGYDGDTTTYQHDIGVISGLSQILNNLSTSISTNTTNIGNNTTAIAHISNWQDTESIDYIQDSSFVNSMKLKALTVSDESDTIGTSGTLMKSLTSEYNGILKRKTINYDSARTASTIVERRGDVSIAANYIALANSNSSFSNLALNEVALFFGEGAFNSVSAGDNYYMYDSIVNPLIQESVYSAPALYDEINDIWEAINESSGGTTYEWTSTFPIDISTSGNTKTISIAPLTASQALANTLLTGITVNLASPSYNINTSTIGYAIPSTASTIVQRGSDSSINASYYILDGTLASTPSVAEGKAALYNGEGGFNAQSAGREGTMDHSELSNRFSGPGVSYQHDIDVIQGLREALAAAASTGGVTEINTSSPLHWVSATNTLSIDSLSLNSTTGTISSSGNILSAISLPASGWGLIQTILPYNQAAAASTFAVRRSDSSLVASYMNILNNYSGTFNLSNGESAIFIGQDGFDSVSSGPEYSAGEGLSLDSNNVFSVNLGYQPQTGSANYAVQADPTTHKLFVNVPGGGPGGGGTLSSIGLSMPSGFTVDNTPLTQDGTIVVGLNEGYTIPQTTDLLTQNNKNVLNLLEVGTKNNRQHLIVKENLWLDNGKMATFNSNVNINGPLALSGEFNFAGEILYSSNNNSKLGSADYPWKNVYGEHFYKVTKENNNTITTEILPQVQANWAETDSSSKAFILNKPTIPAAQIQSDWNQTDNTQKDFIKNKPNITDTNTWRPISLYEDNGFIQKQAGGINTGNLKFKAGSNITISYNDDNNAAFTFVANPATTSIAGAIKTSSVKDYSSLGRDRPIYNVLTQSSSQWNSARFYGIEIDDEDKAYVYIPWVAYGYGDYDNTGTVNPIYSYTKNVAGVENAKVYSDPTVTLQSRTTDSNRYYAIERDAGGHLFVNVPWVAGSDGGSYSEGTGIDIASNGEISIDTSVVRTFANTSISLNGQPKNILAFYAPTSSGIDGQYIKWDNGGPTWADAPSGGQGTVTSINVGVDNYTPINGVVSLPAYPTSLPASDVSDWAKAETKPSYTASEVGALPANTTIPSKTSDLVNDSGFITTDTNTTYKLTLNGTPKGTSGSSSLDLGSFYAPTSTGTEGHCLVADSNGKPVWQALTVSNLPKGTANTVLVGNGNNANPSYSNSPTLSGGLTVGTTGSTGNSITTTLYGTLTLGRYVSGNRTVSLSAGYDTSYNGSTYLNINSSVVSSGKFYDTSDIRLKRNIKELVSLMDSIEDIPIVQYEYKNQEGQKYIGTLAQKLLPLFPELISQDNEGYYSVDYGGLAAVAIQGLKELSKKIKLLEEKIYGSN